MLKNPYREKIDEIGKFQIFRVDGSYVRKHIDPEFTNFGQHYHYPRIPLFEFWIDQEHAPDETHFFIEHLLLEWRLMAEGVPRESAIEKAERKEKREREKSDLWKRLQKENNKKTKKAEAPKLLYVKKLKTYSKYFELWIINGEAVRDLYYIDFTEGGHDYAYPSFVPKNEIWIDDDVLLRERQYIIVHELYERYLMAKKGFSYDDAHSHATRKEYSCRHHPSVLMPTLKDVLRRNKEIASS